MPTIRHWSIQQKLTAITMAVSGLVLLLGSAALVINDRATSREALLQEMASLADLVGTNSTAALTFDDGKAAGETLSALSHHPHLLIAATFNRAGQVFAIYHPDEAVIALEVPETLRQDQPSHLFTGDSLHLTRPITLQGEYVGSVYIRTSLHSLQDRLLRTMAMAAGFFLFSGFLAYLVSHRLHRLASEPLRELATTMHRVSDEHDYALRATVPGSQDEISVLAAGFNNMLVQIQKRDATLKTYGERLETQVAERTAELSRTVRTMEETQHFLNSMIENLPIMVFAKQAGDLTFARWNRAAEELTGYSRDEMLGKCDHDFFPKEEADFFTAKDRDVLAGGTLLDIPEEAIHTKHRGMRILRTKKLPVCDNQGRPQFLLGIAEDITDHKRAETALREQMHLSLLSAEINETLAHRATLPDILQQCTASLIQHLDAAFARIWLIGPGDLCGECYKAASCADHTQCLHLAASAGLSENLNGEFRRMPLGALKIGKIAQGWGAVTTNDVVNDDRLPNKQWLTEHGLQAFAGYPLKVGTQVIGVMALFSRHQLSPLAIDSLERIAQVVSIGIERKRTEAALHGSEERLALTVQGSNVGIWDRNLNTGAAYFSPQWKLQLGCEDHAVPNAWSEWESRLHPDERDLVRNRLQAIIDSAQCRFELEYRLRHADGSYRWILSRGAVIRDVYGVASRMVGIHLDTTETKRAEEELRRTRDAAEAASLANSQFLANMSHEIRTPMNGVLGMTELLLASAQDARQRHLTESIQRSGESLLAVINDILDFSKIEAGKLQLEQIDFDLQETVEESVELFAAPAQRKGLELTCHLSGSFQRTLRGDPVRLRQTLLNLLGNAIKFTSQGAIQVRVEAVADTADIVRLRFSIKDTGVGIPVEAQGKIFEAFSQVDGSTTRRFGGTGLGLTIVKELVELMQGQLGVDSRPGEGSTFWFTTVFQRQAGTAIPVSQEETPLRGKRVLVVDDTATNREILDEHLRSWRAIPTLATSGKDALERLDKATIDNQPFDLAILDLHMPEMDGLMLAQAIRNKQAWAGLRLLMLTSVGYDAGGPDVSHVDSWVTKPIRKTMLYQALLGLTRANSSITPDLDHRQTPADAPARINPLTVLLVEDTLVNREVAIGMLELLGHRVDVAENGQDAVDATAQRTYDIVLMDCQMPVMDGFAATGAIRKREQSVSPKHRLPIIALTAHAVEGDRERCLTAGMDDYLTKPFTLQQLQNILACWNPTQNKPAETRSEPTRSPQASEAVVDETAWDVIRALHRPGRPNLLHKTLSLYLTSSEQLVDQLQEAVRKQNVTAAQIAAHTLKSSSAVLGAQQLADLCHTIERAAQAGAIGTIMDLIPALVAMRTSVCAAFTQELNASKEEAA